MIDITIKDFQSIADADLTIQGITALVGPSNSGKSAIVRALLSLITSPRGHTFIRHGKESCFVVCHVDGHAVAWYKGQRANYVLDGAVFDKIGLEVPQPVQAVLRMPILDVLNAPVNVASQLTGPFFLSLTGPNRAKLIASLSGSDIINAAVSEGNRRRLQLVNKGKELERAIEKANNTLRILPDFKRIGLKLKELKQLDEQLDTMEEKLTIIQRLYTELIKARAVLQEMEERSAALQNIPQLLERYRALELLTSKYEVLSSKYEALVTLQSDLKTQQGVIASIEKELGASVVIDSVKAALDDVDYALVTKAGLTQRLAILRPLLKEWNATKQQIVSLEKELKFINSSIASATEEYNRRLRTLDVCPTCKQVIGSGITL